MAARESRKDAGEGLAAALINETRCGQAARQGRTALSVLHLQMPGFDLARQYEVRNLSGRHGFKRGGNFLVAGFDRERTKALRF